jgi:lysozyme
VTIRDTFGLPALTGELTTDEGREAIPYIDTRGNLSGGIGRNLGRGFSSAEIDFMFTNDVAGCCRDLDAHAAWWRNLSPSKQRVMINLTFNMGWPVLSQFERFLSAMQLGIWPEAATQLRNSKWYSEVGTRGTRVVERLLAEPGAIA